MGFGAVSRRKEPQMDKTQFCTRGVFRSINFKKNYGDQLVFLTTKIGQNNMIIESSERGDSKWQDNFSAKIIFIMW